MFSRACPARRSIAPSPHARGRTPPARRSAGLSGPSRAVTAGSHRPRLRHRSRSRAASPGWGQHLFFEGGDPDSARPLPSVARTWRSYSSRGISIRRIIRRSFYRGTASAAPRLPRSYCCETSGLLEQLGSRTALTSGSSRFFWVTRVEPVSMSSSWASLRMASMAALVPS